MLDISVIIVNYHSALMVIDCINSIKKLTKGISYEVIVVDNASGDGSVETIGNAFDDVKVIASDVNLGFGKANNLGAEYAKGKYLFLLNPDTLLVNNAMKVLFDFLESNPKVGVAGGNLFAPDMSPTPSFCMSFDDLATEKRAASWSYLLLSKLFDKLCGFLGKSRRTTAFNYCDKPQKTAYIFGADMMLSKELFESVGGFDPDFFMYAEEEELTWRITECGYDVYSVPNAEIIHLEGATVKQSDEFSSCQFKMRMNGTLTYFEKRFGLSGVNEFYRLRCLRYHRLMRIAEVQGKLKADSVPAVQQKCLDEVYESYIANVTERGTGNG